MGRIRYAQVGLGLRSWTFSLAIARDHANRPRAGSILTGIAANRSIQTGERVTVHTLVDGLELP